MLKKREKQVRKIETKAKWGQYLQDLRYKKKVRFTPSTSLRERLARIKSYRASRKGQTGSRLASNLAKIGLTMGSKAINSALGKKIITKGIHNIPNMFKYGVSKIKKFEGH